MASRSSWMARRSRTRIPDWLSSETTLNGIEGMSICGRIPVMRRRVCLRVGLAAFAGTPPSVLVHEHVLVDFVGADRIRPGRYDRNEVFRIARPKLEEVKQWGCRRLLDCTPNFLGRDPELLARPSAGRGIRIWAGNRVYCGLRP